MSDKIISIKLDSKDIVGILKDYAKEYGVEIVGGITPIYSYNKKLDIKYGDIEFEGFEMKVKRGNE